MKFKPLSTGTLPRVFINLLALNTADIDAFYTAMAECAEMHIWFNITNFYKHPDFAKYTTRERLAVFVLSILELSDPVRGFFVKDFDRLLNSLECDDVFGTEGQCDPRGDHRD